MQMLKAKKSGVERQNNQIWSSEIIDDLMDEILKRLPIKKVFECMSISKHWQSRILSSTFTKIYSQQHPCYLLINSIDKCNRQHFYYSPLLGSGDMIPEPEEFVNSFTVVGDHLTKVTQPVEGFFCVYSFLGKCLSIYHVWRGEIMKLPYPLVRERSNPPDYFFFGFEPINGVYKLLKITPLDKYLDAITRRHGISLDSTCFECQILATDMDGNNKNKLSWRKLPQNILAPLFHPSDYVIILSIFASLQFSIDGFLFWRSHTHGLICFDLKEEKFFVVKPPPDLHQQDFRDSLTTQFRGQLALFMHNPDVDEKLILCTLTIQQLDDNQGYTYAWTKHFISLLSGLRDRYFPVGNLPTGEILLANFDTKDPFTIVYAYNHETHLFQKFIAGKLKMDFDRLKAQPKKLIYSICCVQPSFSTPDAFGSCASFNSGNLSFLM